MARLSALAPLLVGLGLASTSEAQLTPEWVKQLPVGSSLQAGATGRVVDASGTTYVTGITGSSSNNDALTAAFASDGSLMWQALYDGPEGGSDQARGIALGAGNRVWVTGNTPGPGSYANVLVLAYDALTGVLLQETIYSSGPFTSEYGASIVPDAAGNVYVGGGTVGDGADGLVLKLAPGGALLWSKVWDGPAFGPFSQDQVLQLKMDPGGRLVALIHGVMGSNQPDYVVIEYAPGGTVLWETNWGTNAYDGPQEMELDAEGDVYVTGSPFAVGTTNANYATIKLRGDNGTLVWQAQDKIGVGSLVAALALDGIGGVYITGRSDPDFDDSNQNDNVYTVKRSALDGSLQWTHLYGSNCLYCFDVPGDVLVDPAGFVYLAAVTSSPPHSNDLITLVLDPATGLEIERGVLASTSPVVFRPGALAFDAAHDLYEVAEAYDANTGAVDVTLFKYPTLREGQYDLGVTSLVAGASATFSVTNATPLANQFVVHGFTGLAPAPIPVLGTALGIAAPKLLFWGPADASGALARTLTVPPGTSGVAIWFQALERGASTAPSSHVVD